MEVLTIIVLDGVVFASWLFLVSAGLTFIYGVLRLLNVAHGSMYALGAYLGASLTIWFLGRGYSPWLSYLVLLVAALIVGVTAGPFIERMFLKRIYQREEVVVLLTTFAIFLILEDGIKLVWGVEPYSVDAPYFLLGQMTVAGIAYPWYPFLLTGIAFLAGLALWITMNRTRFGRQVTAVIADREMSAALGIKVSKIDTFAFSFGVFLAALGGAFTAPRISVEPGTGIEVIVLAFAVVAIGGLGSVAGAALGCLLAGILRALAVHLFPELELFVVYALMILVLVFRPRGLFGGVEVRRI